MLNCSTRFRLRLAIIAALACTVSAHLEAAGPTGIRTDGSIGASATTLAGPDFLISQNLGALSGKNLFFSFQYFNIATGETASFQTTTPGLQNVISRVTGGFASSIDGALTLSSLSATPNFFLINPSGVVFTSNAVVDVPAGFNVSTADYLKFPDGKFYADAGKSSMLSASAPEAFGFLGSTRSSVDLEGAYLQAGSAGEAEFQVVAGDVSIAGAGFQAAIQNGSGDVRVVATGAQTIEVPLTGQPVSHDGTVILSGGGALATLGPDDGAAGGIYVTAGSMSVDGADADSTNVVTGLLSVAGGLGAGPITVDVAEELRLQNAGSFESFTRQSSANAADLAINAGSFLVDGGTAPAATGIFSRTSDGGNGGNIALAVSGTATLQGGGQVASISNGAGRAGQVTVSAADLSILGRGVATTTFTGIRTDANDSGDAGDVRIETGSLLIDGQSQPALTGISSSVESGSTGNGGTVSVIVRGGATLQNNALVSSDTSGLGQAGDVTLSAGSLLVDSGEDIFARVSSDADFFSVGNAGRVDVNVSGEVALRNRGAVSSDTYGFGNAGDVLLAADSLLIDGSARVSSDANGSLIATDGGNGGSVGVTVSGQASILDSARISSNTSGNGNAGNVTFTAGSLLLDGILAGISSTSQLFSTGSAGNVSLAVSGMATLRRGGSISSDTEGAGLAGNVTVAAASLMIDGEDGIGTGISSDAGGLSTGSAGKVSVTVSGAATLRNGGFISTEAYRGSAAGDVTVSADTLDVLTGSSISSDTFAAANAGSVDVTVRTLLVAGGGDTQSHPVTGITSDAEPGSTGNAGTVTVGVSGGTTLQSNGVISSSTFGSGDAGNVTLSGASLLIDDAGGNPEKLTGISSAAGEGLTGNAGTVDVAISGTATLQTNGGISSSTFGTGNAGDVRLSANSLRIDAGNANSEFLTGISSGAASGSSGNAGNVTVSVQSLLIDGRSAAGRAGIVSDAYSSSGGVAGTVAITTPSNGTVSLINGGVVSSQARIGSVGRAGSISIETGQLQLQNGGTVTIQNAATVADSSGIEPTSININAQSIDMNGGEISASSTGNVDASSININYARSMYMDPSTVSTSANTGDGGAISINGGGLLWLTDSNITTSVLGTTSGNGGDISIRAPLVILNTGAVQANTAAPLASGGNVSIIADALVPTFESYTLGGVSVPFDPGVAGLNIVQAANPEGVSGDLSVTTPTLDVGNALLRLSGLPARPPSFGRTRCASTLGSSLAVTGRGGIPPSFNAPLWITSSSAPTNIIGSAVESEYLPIASSDTKILFTCR